MYTKNATIKKLGDWNGGYFGKNGTIYKPKMPPQSKNMMNGGIFGLFFALFVPKTPPQCIISGISGMNGGIFGCNGGVFGL